MDSGDVWNRCVDGDVGGVGGHNMFVLITLRQAWESNGLVPAIQDVLANEGDDDAVISIGEVRGALAWAGFAEAREAVDDLITAIDTNELDGTASDEYDAEFTDDFAEGALEELLELKLANHPEEFEVD